MQVSNKDKAYLWDIVQACSDIISFTENLSFFEFSESKLVRYAVERQLLVIGEAANHLSKDFTESKPGIPWKQIIGLRNIIAHDYGEVLVERVWFTIKNHVGNLRDDITQYV